MRCAGPLRYQLDAGVSEGAFRVNGEMTQPVELQCVRCLEKFAFDIVVKDFTVHTDLTGPEKIDLTPFMREDVLLERAGLSSLRSGRRPGLSGPRRC